MTGCSSREEAGLRTAFQNQPKTADLTIKLFVEGEQYRFEATLSGPYQERGAFDFKLHIAGSTPNGIDGRLISNGDAVFVQYKGETYETGKYAAEVRGLLSGARRWFPDSETRKDATLDGEAVTRVTGNLDVTAALHDLGKLLQQRGQPTFTEKDLNEAATEITAARFTVDVGRSDGRLRRIDAHLALDAPEVVSTIGFSIRWKHIDKPVTIKAPRAGKPIEELGKVLDEDFGSGDAEFS